MRHPTLIAALLFGLTACGGDKTPTGTTTGLAHGSMSAKINGAAWSASAGLSAVFSSPNIVAVAGSDGAGRTLGFGLVATGPGTYAVGGLSGTNATYSEGSISYSAALNVGSGSVVVTSLSSTAAAGTFSFTVVQTGGTATKTITEGSFNVKF